MKKRFTPIILALVCILACTVLLAACGSENPFKSKAWKMKSEEVTEQQWAAAFNEDNFKNVKVEITTIQKGQYEKKDGTTEEIEATMKSTIIVADDIWYYKSTTKVNKGSQEIKDEAKDSEAEGYFTKNADGTYTVVHKEDGKWVKDTTDSNRAESELNIYLAYGLMRDWFKFVDAESGYMLNHENIVDVPLDDLMPFNGNRLKFQNGKLAAFFDELMVNETKTEETENGSHSWTEELGRIYRCVIFTYGGQKLTVPNA